MYCVLTDGSKIYSSIVISNDKELAILNNDADEKTDGNFWWEAGSKENASIPKCSCYKHINGGLGGIYVS